MTDPPGSPAFVARAATHRCSLELQWQGRGGRFHHLAFSPRGLRRALGTFGIVVAIVVGALSLASSRASAPGPGGIDAVLRENLELKARRDALRERAYDLAEQLYWHAEQELRMAAPADAPSDAWTDRCSRPPGREAGDEAILAWLTDQGVRLEVLGGRLPSGHDGADGRRMSTRAAAVNRQYVQER